MAGPDRLTEERDGILIATLERPDKLDALSGGTTASKIRETTASAYTASTTS